MSSTEQTVTIVDGHVFVTERVTYRVPLGGLVIPAALAEDERALESYLFDNPDVVTARLDGTAHFEGAEDRVYGDAEVSSFLAVRPAAA